MGAGMSPGSGVQVDSIRRISSQYLVNQLWQTTSKANYFDTGDQYISALEQVIGTDSTSLGNGLDDMFSALSALTQTPESPALRQQLINQAGALATRFNNVNNFISSQKESVDTQRNAMVEQINTLSASIADYKQKNYRYGVHRRQQQRAARSARRAGEAAQHAGGSEGNRGWQRRLHRLALQRPAAGQR
jgi:flagellar hook-associated protein 1 FlgK